jgi:hypothetical protein
MMQHVERWHQLLRDRDPAGLDDLLADDVTFHSPVVHSPQEGKTLTRMYLSAAFLVLLDSDFRYVREVVAGDDAVLEFVANVEGIEINGIDLIHFDATGRIDDFKVMVRPARAMAKLQEKMAAMLAHG